MAAGFTYLNSECRDEAASSSRATTFSITPAVGDICFVHASNFNGTTPALASTGATWVNLGNQDKGGGNGYICTFRCTAAGSSSVLTFSAGANFIDPCWAVYRPVDLTYVGIMGQGGTAGTSSDTLAVTLTNAGTVGGILAYGVNNGTQTFAEDTTNGFTEVLDENVASGRGHTVQTKFSDAETFTVDCSSDTHMAGFVLEFAGAAASGGIRPLVGGVGLVGV